MRLLITTVDQAAGKDPITGDDIPYIGFKVGDIIAVRPDDLPFGRAESIEVWVAEGRNPDDFPGAHFGIIDIPDEPVDLNLMDPEFEANPHPRAGIGDRRRSAERAWRVDPGRLTIAQWAALQEPGARIVLPREIGRQAIRRKEDDQGIPPRFINDGNHTERFPDTLRRQRLIPTSTEVRQPRAGG